MAGLEPLMNACCVVVGELKSIKGSLLSPTSFEETKKQEPQVQHSNAPDIANIATILGESETTSNKAVAPTTNATTPTAVHMSDLQQRQRMDRAHRYQLQQQQQLSQLNTASNASSFLVVEEQHRSPVHVVSSPSAHTATPQEAALTAEQLQADIAKLRKKTFVTAKQMAVSLAKRTAVEQKVQQVTAKLNESTARRRVRLDSVFEPCEAMLTMNEQQKHNLHVR